MCLYFKRVMFFASLYLSSPTMLRFCPTTSKCNSILILLFFALFKRLMLFTSFHFSYCVTLPYDDKRLNELLVRSLSACSLFSTRTTDIYPVMCYDHCFVILVFFDLSLL